MNSFKTLIYTFMLLSINGLYAAGTELPGANPTTTPALPEDTTGTTSKPETDNIMSASLFNTLGATDISDLSGVDEHGQEIEYFIIYSLPKAEAGILYCGDGTTKIIVDQIISLEEARNFQFDPADGYVGDATFTYSSINCDWHMDDSPATVTIPVINGNIDGNPTAADVNVSEMLNTLGAVNIDNLSGKDAQGNAVNSFIITSLPLATQGVLYMADGITAVTLNQTLTLEEANGLRFDPTAGYVGMVTFTYEAIDNTLRSNPATVTIPLVNAVSQNMMVNDDIGYANGGSAAVDIDVLANDVGIVTGSRVRLVDVNNTYVDRIDVANEGIWSVTSENIVRFTPVAPFVGTPSPIHYIVEDPSGTISNEGRVSIEGECICKAYETSIDALNTFGLVLMLLLSTLLGMRLTKKLA